jgi:hypothetical protein
VYARWLFPLPIEYINAATIKCRIMGGMVTTVATTSATVDVECYVVDPDDGEKHADGDLVTTSATTINTLLTSGATTVDFVVNGASRSSGDMLDLRLTFAGVAGAASAMFAEITEIAMLLDVKG